MSKSDWVKEKDNSRGIIWRNKKNPRITVEAWEMGHQSDDPEDKNKWYAFGALDGKGLSTSPLHAENKKEAIIRIAKLKEIFKDSGISGLKSPWR